MSSGSILLSQPIPKGPHDLDLYEVVNGERVEVLPMGALAGSLATILASYLNHWARPKKFGWAVSEVLFNFGPGRNERRPDVAFVSQERCSALVSFPPPDPSSWSVVPNLAVEVISPSNTVVEMEEKILEYFDAGVQRVWVFHPRSQRLYVYESPTQSTILTKSDELEGGKVLPGFRLMLKDLFDDLPPVQ